MPVFKTAAQLKDLIDDYFESLQVLSEEKAANPSATTKSAARVQPALLTGLALHTGFTSMNAFEAYELKGKYRNELRTGRLRVQQAYEKKLHLPAPTGAMFALRCMGWADKLPAEANTPLPKKLRIEVVNTGPDLVHTEKDILL